MEKVPFHFIFGVNERPPWGLTVFYSLQWVFLLFPGLITTVSLCGVVFNLSPSEKLIFSELTFISAGFFTFAQSLLGHRYPIIEGPAMAHLLTVLLLAPLGIKAIQFGMIVGGMALSIFALSGKVSLLRRIFTRNVVVVVLMLVAFTFAPYLAKNMTVYLRRNSSTVLHPWVNFFVSILIILFTVGWSRLAKGSWKTVSMLAGICFGSAIYGMLGFFGLSELKEAGLFLLPKLWTSPLPHFSLVAVISCAIAYVAVIINLLGSVTGVAVLLPDSKEEVEGALKRSIFLNGLSGIVCGFLGIVGLVSYSISPGVILLQRVASRFVLTICGIFVVIVGLSPWVSGLCALIPQPIVASVLCVALGSQIGAALKMIKDDSMSQEDAIVIGLSVILGTIVSVIPEQALVGLPLYIKLFLENGLAFGTLVALFLEHIVFRVKEEK